MLFITKITPKSVLNIAFADRFVFFVEHLQSCPRKNPVVQDFVFELGRIQFRCNRFHFGVVGYTVVILGKRQTQPHKHNESKETFHSGLWFVVRFFKIFELAGIHATNIQIFQ